MSLDTQPAIAHDVTGNDPTPQRGPVARIIAGSLAVGAATALVLTLAVFPGATESVITGSMLIGFSLGWALLAALTVRFTSTPQRWALVPAAAMGTSGTALLVFTPGSDSMATMNWLWPPAVLALAAWMLVRTGRNLTGRSRWLVTPVIAVLAMASVGATYENLTGSRDAKDAPGTTYEVNGHRLHLDCHGQGSPTVVLSNGLGETTGSWARIAGTLARTTRVCAFDRAGQGWSEAAEHPQDAIASARDLHTLLATAGERAPFVLVGHSTGGTYALTYAAHYPGQVAGMVLLDSSSPEQLTRMPAYPGQYALMRRGFALTPTLSRLGLGLTPEAARNARDEISVIPEVFADAQELTTLGDRPLVVITASDNVRTVGWTAAQDQLAALSTNHVHRTVHSSHAGLVEDERPSAESTRAIGAVVSSVRSGRPLGTP